MSAGRLTAVSRTLKIIGFALLLAVLTAGSAQASWRYRTFVSPSKTTICRIAVDRTGKEKTWVRCDVNKAVNKAPKKPAGCEFDWGFSFGMNSTGRARRNCVSDAIADPSKTKKLAYGSFARLGGISCHSRTAAMTCTNRSGHGFSLSRTRQKIF